MVDIIVRDLTKAPNEPDFLKFYAFKDEEWEKVSEVIKHIKDGDGKGLGLCDKCDYFVSVEEAYKNGEEDGRTKAIDECAWIMSHIPNFCRICPIIDCAWKPTANCKEQWAMLLGKLLKEKNE